jgi:hypothetical protein
MQDKGMTERWFGLTARQYRKVITPATHQRTKISFG